MFPHWHKICSISWTSQPKIQLHDIIRPECALAAFSMKCCSARVMLRLSMCWQVKPVHPLCGTIKPGAIFPEMGRRQSLRSWLRTSSTRSSLMPKSSSCSEIQLRGTIEKSIRTCVCIDTDVIFLWRNCLVWIAMKRFSCNPSLLQNVFRLKLELRLNIQWNICSQFQLASTSVSLLFPDFILTTCTSRWPTSQRRTSIRRS